MNTAQTFTIADAARLLEQETLAGYTIVSKNIRVVGGKVWGNAIIAKPSTVSGEVFVSILKLIAQTTWASDSLIHLNHDHLDTLKGLVS